MMRWFAIFLSMGRWCRKDILKAFSKLAIKESMILLIELSIIHFSLSISKDSFWVIRYRNFLFQSFFEFRFAFAYGMCWSGTELLVKNKFILTIYENIKRLKGHTVHSIFPVGKLQVQKVCSFFCLVNHF